MLLFSPDPLECPGSKCENIEGIRSENYVAGYSIETTRGKKNRNLTWELISLFEVLNKLARRTIRSNTQPRDQGINESIPPSLHSPSPVLYTIPILSPAVTNFVDLHIRSNPKPPISPPYRRPAPERPDPDRKS